MKLPQGWAATKLSEITPADAPIIYGILQPGPNLDDGVPYVRPTEIDRDGIDLSSVRRTSPKIASQYLRSMLKAGDLILSIVGTIGKVADTPSSLAGGNITQSSCRIRPNSELIEGGFLKAFLRAPNAIAQYDRKRLGTAVPRLNIADIREFEISLPPPPEQRRIITKLEALDARLVRARQALGRIDALALKQRQALARESLLRIAAGAPFGRFEDQVDVLTSGSRDWAKYYDRGLSVFVLAGNVRRLFFDPTPKKLVDPPLDGPDARRSRIEKDDLLITIVGAGTGDVCVVPGEFTNYFVCQSVARIKLLNPVLSSFYAYWFATPGCGRSDVERVIYGAARPHLSFDHLRAFLVPLVDPEVAVRAVKSIEAGLARAAHLESEAGCARVLIDRLESAILTNAFRGELVPQDPNDEPASVLLERIQAQRASAPKAKRGRRAAAAAR